MLITVTELAAQASRHGFTDIGSHPLTPMHALTYGRNPRSP